MTTSAPGTRPLPALGVSRNGTIAITSRGEIHPIANSDDAAQLRPLIVAERREFVRGCLSCWVAGFCREFQVIGVSTIETSVQADVLQRAAAAIIGGSAAMLSDGSVDAQIAWLRANRADLPIVLIIESDQAGAAEDLVNRLGLQGYIPTSSSVEIAAAAIRLVAAGGSYFPRFREDSQPPAPARPGPPAQDPATAAKFTPRERAVLDLLCLGTPNKVIAYRLGSSLSTVKVHVHNIIKKLNVQNRTEVAVASRLLQARANGGNRVNGLDAGPMMRPGAEVVHLAGRMDGPAALDG